MVWRLSVVAALLVQAALWTACSSAGKAADPPSRPAIVAAAKAARKDLSREWILSAEFRPFQEIDVHAKVSGYVKAIYVDVGDRVKKGQLLATLEVPELESEGNQAVAVNKHNKAEIEHARGELDRAESAHTVAHAAYTRLAQVIKSRPNLIAQQDIDDALGRDRVSEAQVSAAKAGLLAAEEQLQASLAGVEKAQTLLAYARITAPFSGVITKRYADTGAMIQSSIASQTQTMPLVRLSQNELLRLVIPIPESMVSRVHAGTAVEVKVPSLGKSYSLKVSRSTEALDLATRTMPVEVDVPNPRSELAPGMFASAVVSLDKKPNALTVPLRAVARNGEQATVLVITPQNIIEPRSVTLGVESPTDVEVLSGVKDNETVVVGNQGQLKAGQAVEPKLTKGEN